MGVCIEPDWAFLCKAETWFNGMAFPLLIFLFAYGLRWLGKLLVSEPSNDHVLSHNYKDVPQSEARISSSTIDQFASLLYSHIKSAEIGVMVPIFLTLSVAFGITLTIILIGTITAIWQQGLAALPSIIEGVFQILGDIAQGGIALSIAGYIGYILGRVVFRNAVANCFWHSINDVFPSEAERQEVANYSFQLVERESDFKEFLLCRNSRQAISSYIQGKPYGPHIR